MYTHTHSPNYFQGFKSKLFYSAAGINHYFRWGINKVSHTVVNLDSLQASLLLAGRLFFLMDRLSCMAEWLTAELIHQRTKKKKTKNIASYQGKTKSISHGGWANTKKLGEYLHIINFYVLPRHVPITLIILNIQEEGKKMSTENKNTKASVTNYHWYLAAIRRETKNSNIQSTEAGSLFTGS